MIELDIRDILFLLVMAISVATNIVAVWMLRHNVPELHQDVKDLKERFHKLDKGKLTREFPTSIRKPGHWPVAKIDVGDHSRDAERYAKAGEPDADRYGTCIRCKGTPGELVNWRGAWHCQPCIREITGAVKS